MKKINCILLIDDNPADNEYHKIIIAEANVCNYVKVAIDGTKALDYIIKAGEVKQSEASPKPDLICLDINMPGMNGFEFLQEYQNLDERLKAKIVIIMLTTSLNPDDRERVNKIKDVTEFQNKPLTVEMLHDILEKYF